jgi:hypothetical protein
MYQYQTLTKWPFSLIGFDSSRLFVNGGFAGRLRKKFAALLFV